MTISMHSGPAALCARSMGLMGTGSREDFERVFHPQAVNREAAAEPPLTRQPGPAGFYVTYQSDTTIVDAVMPPTGKAFAITQTHWFRTRDGMITGHWANRDDLAMARQAGWVPPSPGFLLRAALAKRRARQRPA